MMDEKTISDCEEEEEEGVQDCDHEPRLEFDDSELEQNRPDGNYAFCFDVR